MNLIADCNLQINYVKSVKYDIYYIPVSEIINEHNWYNYSSIPRNKWNYLQSYIETEIYIKNKKIHLINISNTLRTSKTQTHLVAFENILC